MRPDKSLDASGGSGFRNWPGAEKGALIRAAAVAISSYQGEGVGLGLVAALNPGPILSSSPSSVPFTFL